MGRYGHFARFGVKFDVYIHLITSSDSGFLAVLRADSDHEFPPHNRHRTAIGLAIDGDADWRPFARSKTLNDFVRNVNTRRRLASCQDFCMKPHAAAY
jgi:hypothetical protein